MRRHPIYFLLDCSSAMQGEPIESVRCKLRLATEELRSDPQGVETAYLSVIKFSTGAEQLCPLTELLNFKQPCLDIGGNTSLGAALQILDRCMDRELTQMSPNEKGDYRPHVFVLIGTLPTDDWRVAAERLQNKRCTILTFVASSSVDLHVFPPVLEYVFDMQDLIPLVKKAVQLPPGIAYSGCSD